MQYLLAVLIWGPLLGSLLAPQRLNRRLVGSGAIAGGLSVEAVYRLVIADWAGRLEMSRCAVLEACLFGPGLLVLGAGLIGWPAPAPRSARGTWGAGLPGDCGWH